MPLYRSQIKVNDHMKQTDLVYWMGELRMTYC